MTSADIHPSGRRLLLRSYDHVWEWMLRPEADFAEIFRAKPAEAPSQAERLGEALAYDPVTGGYLHVGEGRNQPLYSVPCK